MKKLLSSIFIAAVAFVLSPQSAEAKDSYSKSYTYVSGYTHCGCAIYTKRVFRHYDCYGHAVYAYYKQPVKHHCTHHRSVYRSKKSHYHKRYHYRQPYYSRSRSSCSSRGSYSFTYRR